MLPACPDVQTIPPLPPGPFLSKRLSSSSLCCEGLSSCVLEADRTEIIPSAHGSVFCCKKPHGSPEVSSVCGNGSLSVLSWDRASL